MAQEDPYKEYPTMKAALERTKTCFGSDGKTFMPCDNKCGTNINAFNFNVFMLPESKGYEVLFCCLKCCKQLLTQYDYSNKN